MDSISSNRMMPTAVRKAKKQVKDELNRLKQAEKKKRRLEKALATSAAICSELEKKKQMKKEEQQRLDEEGAAIAEAVALRVLLGEEEDSDDCCKIDFNFNGWDCANKVDLVDGISWVSEGCGSGCDWGNGDWSCFSAGSYGVLAAQAVSALHIADDNGMLRG